MNGPELSVIMPMRNAAHCVARMLDSLLLQMRRHNIGMELIVIDDASDDVSPVIVSAWASANGATVKIISNPQRLWSYGSRLTGFALATAPHVWCVDADDNIPETANLGAALGMARTTGCDILHCRASGVHPPSPLHLPLSWTEPLAWHLEGTDIFSTFMAASYPPGILWNKIFSLRLAREIMGHAPKIEVRYFDVKFFGLLAPLLAHSYQACNEEIYEYAMRAHRPAELYSRQVAALLLLKEHLGPIVAKIHPAELETFNWYCLRRLTIQAGHLSIMAANELERLPAASIIKWFESDIFPNIDMVGLRHALVVSLRANVKRIRSYGEIALGALGQPAKILPPRSPDMQTELGKSSKEWLDGRRDMHTRSAIASAALAMTGNDTNRATPGYEGEIAVLTGLLLANASLAKAITAIVAPQTDITKKAN